MNRLSRELKNLTKNFKNTKNVNNHENVVKIGKLNRKLLVRRTQLIMVPELGIFL